MILEVTPPLAQALALRASIEPSSEVRSQLASSARRLPARDALPIVRAPAGTAEDERDIHIPLLLWWAIEAKVASDPELVLAMFSENESWNLPIVKSTVIERLMRRFAASGTRAGFDPLRQLLALAPGPDHVKRLMSGLRIGLRRPVARGPAARAASTALAKLQRRFDHTRPAPR